MLDALTDTAKKIILAVIGIVVIILCTVAVYNFRSCVRTIGIIGGEDAAPVNCRKSGACPDPLEESRKERSRK